MERPHRNGSHFNMLNGEGEDLLPLGDEIVHEAGKPVQEGIHPSATPFSSVRNWRLKVATRLELVSRPTSFLRGIQHRDGVDLCLLDHTEDVDNVVIIPGSVADRLHDLLCSSQRGLRPEEGPAGDHPP